MSDTGTTTDPSISDGASAQARTGDDRHSIQTYVSDMLALERHIAQPLARQTQLDETANYGSALSVISQIKSLTDAHIAALEQSLAQLGGHAADPVKSAWSGLLGIGAAAVDSVRKTKISKSLRDDYTALSLATASYTLLHATAVGLGETAVADLAKRQLADYARLVMQIAQVLPAVVLEELRDDGESVATGAAETIRQQTNAIWKDEASVTR